jgi:hypothetical protein
LRKVQGTGGLCDVLSLGGDRNENAKLLKGHLLSPFNKS